MVRIPPEMFEVVAPHPRTPLRLRERNLLVSSLEGTWCRLPKLASQSITLPLHKEWSKQAPYQLQMELDVLEAVAKVR